jgi:RNA polymerase sigma-70 factor (ECF subfamily)
MPSEDVLLVQRAQAGDVSAYDELVRRHLDRAHAVAFRILRDREDARDVAQDAFVRAWRALPRFEGRSEFSTWLQRIVTNLAINRLQRDRLRSATSIDDLLHLRDPREAAPVENTTTTRRVAEAIAALPPAQRTAFVLRFQEDLSVKETAERMGVSEGAVKASAFHAIRKLRTALADLAPEIGGLMVESVESDEGEGGS